MAGLGRPGLSDLEKVEVWRPWHDGESLSEIRRALSKHAASIFGVLRLFGGYQPAKRTRRASSLGSSEHEVISESLSAGQSMLKIATDLGRSPSTISRKINRNGGVAGYRAAKADARAWDWARRPKRCALALNGRLRFIIASKLSQEWSPVQISGWLSFTYPDDESLHVSHERIYKSLFVQSRGVLKKELQAHLRPSVFFANLERIIREGMREAALLTPSRSQNLRPKSRIEPSQVTGRAI